MITSVSIHRIDLQCDLFFRRQNGLLITKMLGMYRLRRKLVKKLKIVISEEIRFETEPMKLV